MNWKIDKKELESFIDYYGKFIERLPSIKAQAIYAAGKVLQQEVQSQIDQQGISDSFGRVKRWQQLYLGSNGGYAAIRPLAEYTDSTWKGKPVLSKQLTRWLEKGHAARKPSGNNPRYEPRIKKAVLGSGGVVVKGRLFYSWAKSTGSGKALDAAMRELDRITDEWEWE